MNWPVVTSAFAVLLCALGALVNLAGTCSRTNHFRLINAVVCAWSIGLLFLMIVWGSPWR